MKPNKVYASKSRTKEYPRGRPRFTPWAMEGKAAPATRSELIERLLETVRSFVEAMR